MRDLWLAPLIGLAAGGAYLLVVFARYWLSQLAARRRAREEASAAKLLALMQRLDGCYAMIRSLERHIATLDKLSALLTAQQRKLEALAPSGKEPSSG